MSLRDAAQQALEVLETCDAAHISDGGQQWYDSKAVDAAITALEAALAEPQPQPQPLTDEQIEACYETAGHYQSLRPQDRFAVFALARAIEKAHNIGGDK